MAALLAGAEGWEGIFTHFHSASSDERATTQQWRRLHEAIGAIGSRPPLVHAANSAAGAYGATFAADLARPGIHLYGGHLDGLDAVPVASLRARVTGVRRILAGDPVSYDATWRAPHATTIATLGIGYGDGWPRAHANNGWALVHGRRVPIVGAVSMDGLTVDVGEVPGVTYDDEFVLIGEQADGRITADEVADERRTINYEVTTALRERLPRLHLGAD